MSMFAVLSCIVIDFRKYPRVTKSLPPACKMVSLGVRFVRPIRHHTSLPTTVTSDPVSCCGRMFFATNHSIEIHWTVIVRVRNKLYRQMFILRIMRNAANLQDMVLFFTFMTKRVDKRTVGSLVRVVAPVTFQLFAQRKSKFLVSCRIEFRALELHLPFPVERLGFRAF